VAGGTAALAGAGGVIAWRRGLPVERRRAPAPAEEAEEEAAPLIA
jgi:hypothetical protein